VGSKNEIQRATVQNIINSVVKELAWNPDRKFIYVEQFFFSTFWDQAQDKMRTLLRQLVASGQLEFINGGFVMHDEAAPAFADMLDQTTLGHRFLLSTFNVTPTCQWAIDPFGHSAFNAYAMSSAVSGYNALFFARLSKDDWSHRDATRTGEWIWAASPSSGMSTATYAGILYGGYCTVDGINMDGNNDPVQDDPNLEDVNVGAIVDRVVGIALDALSKIPQGGDGITADVMLPLGCDFNYENAATWFTNTDKLIHYLNLDGRLNAFYSTPSIYAAAKLEAGKSYTLKTDDLFPYNDGDHSFWTGYFTSRPALKAYVRESSALFHSARQLQALSGLPLPADKGRSNPLFALERAMAIAQHHDAVSGTSKQAVADDYALRLSAGRDAAEALVGSALSALTRSDPAATAWARCELLNATLCPALEAGLATVVAVWNQRSSAPPPGYNGSSPATVNLLLPVGLPPGVASWAVSDASGAPLPAQLLPLTPADTALRTQYYGAPLATPINWLALQVPVPLLGFATLFLQPVAAAGAAPATAATPRTPVAPGSGDVTLANGQLALVFDSATGLLKEHQDLQRGGAATPLAQAFLYYNSSRGESGGDDAGQASGAYIFRPNGTSAYPLQPPGTPVALTVARGSVVSEVTQVHAGWASQTVRLWAGARSAVFEYTVGPIPGADGAVPAGLGTEVVTRYSTPLRSNKTWHSDSNGRDSIVRVRDYRASWAYNATVEPVAGNYVPVSVGRAAFLSPLLSLLLVLTHTRCASLPLPPSPPRSMPSSGSATAAQGRC
jgi:alpha-mannosidase